MKNNLKRAKTILLATSLLAISSLLIQSCKDDDGTTPKDPPLGQAMGDFFTKNKLDGNNFTLTLSGGNIADTLHFGKGYALIVSQGTFLINGTPASGTLNVNATLVDTKSDMILGGISCFGDSGKAIQSSGMLKLEVSQNGTKATIDHAKPLNIRVPQKGSAQSDFKTFRGDGSNNSDSTKWVVDDKSRGIPSSQSYIISTTTLNWINCDRFYNNPNNVKFDVKLPSGYTNANGSVYVVFKNDHSMCRMYGNTTTQSFDFGTYLGIPSGTLLKIVVVASQGTQLQYAEQDYTSASGTVTFTAMTNTTDAALKTYLDGL